MLQSTGQEIQPMLREYDSLLAATHRPSTHLPPGLRVRDACVVGREEMRKFLRQVDQLKLRLG
eukprot:5975377-Pyramimonas_sp.AAC.1